KALAIAPDGIGLADGQPDIESAKQEALRQCAISAKRVCRIYAAGMDVVWSKGFLPVPASGDLRTEPLDARLVADQIPTFNGELRRAVEQGFANAPVHKALAMSTNSAWFYVRRATKGEA